MCLRAQAIEQSQQGRNCLPAGIGEPAGHVLAPGRVVGHDEPARLLAVEMLLADPQALRNDALETDLYILRDQLRTIAEPLPAAT